MWELSYHGSFMSDTSAVKESGVCMVSIQFACTVTECRGKARGNTINLCLFFSFKTFRDVLPPASLALTPLPHVPEIPLGQTCFFLDCLRRNSFDPSEDPQTTCI